jgi:ribonuclease Y
MKTGTAKEIRDELKDLTADELRQVVQRLARFKKENKELLTYSLFEAHHEDVPIDTVEAAIVQIADAISSARPGARRDSVENYIKRLQDLEALTKTFDGVEKSYALAAGREIRIFVTPEKVSDLGAKEMARDIAKKIEEELTYPGEIKVTMIRENRITEYAR